MLSRKEAHVDYDRVKILRVSSASAKLPKTTLMKVMSLQVQSKAIKAQFYPADKERSSGLLCPLS